MPEEKRPLGRPRRRWVDNIKMDRREIGWDGMVRRSLLLTLHAPSVLLYLPTYFTDGGAAPTSWAPVLCSQMPPR
jgi:hypothetical protein